MNGQRPRDHDKAIDRYVFFGAHRRLREMRNAKAGGAKRFAQVAFSVSIAQRRQQFHAVCRISLHREGRDPGLDRGPPGQRGPGA